MRARRLRGALVGAASTLMTTGAHAAGGGGVPRGPALLIVLLICLTAGALAACARTDHGTGYLTTASALGGAQLCGHLALMTAGHHHGAFGWSMAAAHIAAALLLAAAITSVQFLYAVCVSILCWLRLFALRALRPTAPRVRYRATIARPRPVPIGGTGMRAPPALTPAG